MSDLEKRLKQTKIAIILSFVNMGLLFILFFVSLFLVYPILAEKISLAVGTIIILVLLIIAVLAISITVFVYHIILTIYGFELENKTSAILLVVGFVVGIVGLVGLFFLANEIRKLQSQIKEKENIKAVENEWFRKKVKENK